MTICRILSLVAVLAAASAYPAQAQFGGMPGMPGSPGMEEIAYPEKDSSWELEWASFARAIDAADERLLNGDLGDARYAWEQIEAAYAAGPYAQMREAVAV